MKKAMMGHGEDPKIHVVDLDTLSEASKRRTRDSTGVAQSGQIQLAGIKMQCSGQ